jgi:hypothetical protein
MSDMSDRRRAEYETGTPVPEDLQARRAGMPRMTLWVALVTLLVCLVIGGMILTDTDEVPPSDYRATEQAAPNGGTPPAAPQTEPQTRQ